MPTPWKVSCRTCGEELIVPHRSMDSDGDIYVEVQPCETCLEQVRIEMNEAATIHAQEMDMMEDLE